MGGVASQPAVPLPPGSQVALDVNKLASIASRYEQLKRDFSALSDEHEAHAGNLKSQSSQFRQQLQTFQRDFEAKLSEQQKRNADLNARERILASRNADLQGRLGEIKAKQKTNANSSAVARTAAVRAASDAASAEKTRLETAYSQELAQIEAPLRSAREEFTRLTEQLADLEKKTSEKPSLNAAVATAKSERNSLNANITTKRIELNALNKNIRNQTSRQANLATGISRNTERQGQLATNLESTVSALTSAKERITAQIQEEEAKLPTKLAELESNLAKEIEASRISKMQALELELVGIRKGEEEKNEALLAEAQAKAAEAIAISAQEIAVLREKEESERASRLATDTAEIEIQKAEVAKERAETEATIRALEERASVNSASRTKLAEERAELERLKAEQVQFESEKTRIQAEQTASRYAMETAKREATEARALVEQAMKEKLLADQERIKAEKIEKYRKHVYQIIKDWIGPLEREGIRTFHDDEKDDYFFQHGTETKSWVQEKTIQTLAKKYPYLKWQPRPAYNVFSGGRTRRISIKSYRKNKKTTRKH